MIMRIIGVLSSFTDSNSIMMIIGPQLPIIGNNTAFVSNSASQEIRSDKS